MCSYSELFSANRIPSNPATGSSTQRTTVKFEFDHRSYGASNPTTSSTSFEIITSELSHRQGESGQSSRQRSVAGSGNRITSASLPVALPDAYHQDLELLQHYLAVTASSVSRHPGRLHIWKAYIPNVARSHEYAMNALEGLAALHIAHIRPLDYHRYLRLGISYHHRAITGFRNTVKVIQRDNSDGVLIFSGLLVLMELALMNSSYALCDSASDQIDQLLQRFMLIRNIFTMFKTAPALRTALASQILVGEPSLRGGNVATEVQSMLEQLENINQKTTANLGERETYSHSIRVLLSDFSFVVARPDDWFALLHWINYVTPKYLELLHAKQPMALAILANYCVLIYHAPLRQWWLRGWSRKMLQAVAELLDDSWMQYMSRVLKSMKPDSHLLQFASSESCA